MSVRRVLAPCTLLLSLAAGEVTAAPVVPHAHQPALRHARARTVWGLHARARKAFLKRFSRGPVRKPSALSQAGLTDTIARIRRVAPKSLTEDDTAAIQNDGAAAPAELKLSAPDFRSLGFLTHSFDKLLPSPFLPRSSRGPPV